MKYRIARQWKSDGAISRAAPAVFDSYESAHSEAKNRNKKYPDAWHWAEAAPEREAEPFYEDWPTELVEEEEYSCGYNTVWGAFHKPECKGECEFMNHGEAD